jgi:hypothetical protein
MQKKLIFFSTVIVLFLIVLFLDENSAPVPVKIILGDPKPISLSSIIVVSILVGIALSMAGIFTFNAVRKPKKNLKVAE